MNDGQTGHIVHGPVPDMSSGGSRQEGRRMGLRRARAGLLGRPRRRRARREEQDLRQEPQGDPRQARPEGLRDQQPPRRPARLRPEQRRPLRHVRPAVLQGQRRRPSASGPSRP